MTPATQSRAVHWEEQLGAFVVTGFEEASAVLRGQGWSSDPARSPLTPPELTELPTSLMLFSDPPDHTRLRRLVAPAFAARAIESLRPRVAAIVDACLDGLGEAGEEVDLLADYAYLIPMAVIAELLDVGVEGAQVFLEQTPQLVRMLEVNPTSEDLSEAVTAALEVTLFLAPILSRRRAGTGGEDFVSALLATQDLSLEEVMATCVLLLAAGHETTANIIGTGSMAVLSQPSEPSQPSQRSLLLQDPGRATEELIRLHGPVKLIARTSLTDHEVAGTTVRAGQQVVVRVDQANRDPRRWEAPERLDLSRPGPANLGFGTGIHFCLGAALARLEASEALVRLHARHPGLAMVDAEPHWRASSTFHALDDLAVRLG